MRCLFPGHDSAGPISGCHHWGVWSLLRKRIIWKWELRQIIPLLSSGSHLVGAGSLRIQKQSSPRAWRPSGGLGRLLLRQESPAATRTPFRDGSVRITNTPLINLRRIISCGRDGPGDWSMGEKGRFFMDMGLNIPAFVCLRLILRRAIHPTRTRDAVLLEILSVFIHSAFLSGVLLRIPFLTSIINTSAIGWGWHRDLCAQYLTPVFLVEGPDMVRPRWEMQPRKSWRRSCFKGLTTPGVTLGLPLVKLCVQKLSLGRVLLLVGGAGSRVSPVVGHEKIISTRLNLGQLFWPWNKGFSERMRGMWDSFTWLTPMLIWVFFQRVAPAVKCYYFNWEDSPLWFLASTFIRC